MPGLVGPDGRPIAELLDREERPAAVAPACASADPHARAHVPVWNRVIICAEARTQFCALGDQNGTLVIAVKPHLSVRWPVAIPAPVLAERRVEISVGGGQFEITSNLLAPPVDHPFVPSADDPKACRLCAVEPVNTWMLVTKEAAKSEPDIVEFAEDQVDAARAAKREAAARDDVEYVALKLVAKRKVPGVSDDVETASIEEVDNAQG